jgi:hypothetical protein
MILGEPSPRLEALWYDALMDAAPLGPATILIAMTGESLRDDLATTWFPDAAICGEERDDLGPFADIANSEGCIRKSRIAIWPSESDVVLAALLRHELEHVRQFDQVGHYLVDLIHDAQAILRDQTAGIESSGVLYQWIPTERDANCAASPFARRLFEPGSIARELEDNWALLAPKTTQPNPTSIRQRMETFIEREAAVLARRFTDAIVAGADWRTFRAQD